MKRPDELRTTNTNVILDFFAYFAQITAERRANPGEDLGNRDRQRQDQRLPAGRSRNRVLLHHRGDGGPRHDKLVHRGRACAR